MNLEYQYHCEGTTRTLEVATIDQIRVVRVPRPEVVEVDGGIRLKFADGEKTSLSTILRSNSGYVDYTIKDLGSIPHDFVQACLTPIEQSRVIGGQTPDVIWDDEDGKVNVIEIATRHVHSYEKARHAVGEKLNKYYHHVAEGRIQKINILVVYMQGVITLGDVLDMETVHALVDAYHTGLAILEEIKLTTTLEVAPDMDSMLKESKWLASRSFPERPKNSRGAHLILDPELRELIKNNNGAFKFSVLNEPIRKEKAGALSSWLASLPGKRMDTDTVVHLPLILPATPEEAKGYEHLRSYEPFMPLHVRGDVQDLDLREWRKLSLQTRREIRKIDRSYDEPVTLEEHHRIGIAERGVLKKSVQHLQAVQEADNRQSESYSGLCDTRDIEDFLTTPLAYMENDIVTIDEIEEFHIPDNSGFDPHDLVHSLLNTDLFHALSFLDVLVREVILSMKDNPKDFPSRNQYGFISKRIGKFNVIIRPTKYSSTSDTPTHFLITCLDPFKPIHGIFEQVYKTGVVYHTKFVSLSRLRAEHFCNILPQCISLYAMALDELGSGISPHGNTLEDLNQVVYPAKCMILTLLEDKEYTSRNLQQMRYYYMELLGTGWKYAEKIAGKLDPLCRSRLFLHFVKTIITIGDVQTNDGIKRALEDESKEEANPTSFSGSDSGSSDGSETIAFLGKLRANEAHVDVTSFMKVRHLTLQTLLTPMYLSVLHNKNEMEKTLSSKQIVGKILQEEYKLEASMHCRGDLSDAPDLASYRSHDWSLPVVKRASMLLREELLALTHEDLHTVAIRRMFSTTMDELATTKASHSGIFDDRLSGPNDADKVGVRDKCFVQMLKLGELPSARLLDNVEHFRDMMVKDNDSRVLVQMFKKNQIGGTREILILDFVSRCLIRLLEDMSRSLCDVHPYEMLTKPSSKGMMTAQHQYKLKQARFSGTVLTWRASLDKTTWAQQFVNPTFYTLLSTLVPDYSEFIAFVLDCHTRKRIELPRDLVNSFYKAKKSDLSDYQVNNLRDEFLGFKPPVVTDGPYRPYINNASNMMQGILHYTSSLLHVAYSVMLRHLMTKVVKESGNQLVYSCQVSSDDSGIIASVLLRNPDSSPAELAQKLDREFQCLISTLDKAFSVRTSMHKSTMTFRPIYEFNSAFYSGNNYTNPLIKFVARACDDSPAESLRSRVIGFHNSLREVRANGGSGALCSVVSVCQKISLFMNLGYKTMRFFREYSDPLRMYKLSHIGVYCSMPPILAGLYGADFADFYACMTDPASHNLMSTLHRRPLIGGKLLSDLSGFYRAWPTDRYKGIMEELGIQPGFGNSLKFKDLEVLFRPVMSWDDAVVKVELNVSNQSTARSFSFLTRCETIMSSAYLLWDKIFMHAEGGLALEELIQAACQQDEPEGPASLDRIFPNHVDLMSVFTSLRNNVESNHLPSRYIYRPHTYEPVHSGLNDMRLIKSVLASKWYGLVVRDSRTTIELAFKSLQDMLPWLSEDPEETLAQSGMSSPLELINYVTLLAERVKPIKLVSMGGTRKNRSLVENVALLNTFRNKICFLRSPDAYVENFDVPSFMAERGPLIRRFQNRVADWHQLISHFHGDWERVDQLVEVLNADFRELAEKYRKELMVSLHNNAERRTASEFLSLIDDAVWNNYVVRNADRPLDVHIGELRLSEHNKHRGETVIIRKRGHQLYRITVLDGKVIRLASNGPECDMPALERSYPFFDWRSPEIRYNQDIFFMNPDRVLYYKGQLYLANGSGRRTHYLCPVFQVYGVMLPPLEFGHVKRNLLSFVWLSRSVDISLINAMMEYDPALVEDFKTICRNSIKMISTARVRAQFEREEKKMSENLARPEQKRDIDEFMDELFAGYGFTDAEAGEEPYINPDFVHMEYMAEDMDFFDLEFRSEPDIGYLAMHPLMSEVIRMINFRNMGRSGLQRVALDIARERDIINEQYYQQICGNNTMEDLINAFISRAV